MFARDPSNESLALRGAQQTSLQTPYFTISDSNYNAATPNTSLLGVLGAGNINSVQQDATNDYGSDDNGVANSLVNLFQSNVGFPALETEITQNLTAGQSYTLQLPAGVDNVQVGQQLTIDAQTGGGSPQENVTVSAVSYNASGVESVTFTPALNHTIVAPATFISVTSAQTQTLQQQYGALSTQVGLDTSTANTGTTTQTNLASSIDQERQSIAGINIDEQTQDLIKYQTAYQAAAKTISTLSQLLDTIVTGLGVGA